MRHHLPASKPARLLLQVPPDTRRAPQPEPRAGAAHMPRRPIRCASAATFAHSRKRPRPTCDRGSVAIAGGEFVVSSAAAARPLRVPLPQRCRALDAEGAPRCERARKPLHTRRWRRYGRTLPPQLSCLHRHRVRPLRATSPPRGRATTALRTMPGPRTGNAACLVGDDYCCRMLKHAAYA